MYLTAATTITTAVKRTDLISCNSSSYDESEFLQKVQILSWSKELEHALASSSGLVQPPVSSVPVQSREEISSKLVLRSDVSPLPDIQENVRSTSPNAGHLSAVPQLW